MQRIQAILKIKFFKNNFGSDCKTYSLQHGSADCTWHLNYFTITQTLNLLTLPTLAKHSQCATLEPGREEMFSNADMASNK